MGFRVCMLKGLDDEGVLGFPSLSLNSNILHPFYIPLSISSFQIKLKTFICISYEEHLFEFRNNHKILYRFSFQAFQLRRISQAMDKVYILSHHTLCGEFCDGCSYVTLDDFKFYILHNVEAGVQSNKIG